MKIANAAIIFTKEDTPMPKVIALDDEKDLLTDCNIRGGQITCENDMLFKNCVIVNCEYKIKDWKPPILPCPVVDSCRITDCKLPHTYYWDCYFGGGKEK